MSGYIRLCSMQSMYVGRLVYAIVNSTLQGNAMGSVPNKLTGYDQCEWKRSEDTGYSSSLLCKAGIDVTLYVWVCCVAMYCVSCTHYGVNIAIGCVQLHAATKC